MLVKLLHRVRRSIRVHCLFRYLYSLAHWSGILAPHSNTPSAGYLFLFFRTHVSALGDLCFSLRAHCTMYIVHAHTSVRHSAARCNTVKYNPTQCNKLHTAQFNTGHLSATQCIKLHIPQCKPVPHSATQSNPVQHSSPQCNTGGRRVSPGGSLLPPLFMFCTGCTSVPAYATVSGLCTFQ